MPSSTITLTTTTTSGQATLTVNTRAASALFKPATRPNGPNWFLTGEVGAFIACFFLLGISAQKRRSLVFLAMVLIAVLTVATACGSSNSNSGSNPGTTTGAYTATVTATPSGATAQQTMIAVIVQ